MRLFFFVLLVTVANMIESNRIALLHPYVPGEQPKDRPYIKLNANENPFPPSSHVIERVSDFAKQNPHALSRYPDPDSENLKHSIASLLNQSGGVLQNAKNENGTLSPNEKNALPFEITSDMIYCGNGSDEVLSFLFYAFFNSGETIALPAFTYSFYQVYAGFYDIPIDFVPLKKDFSLDTAELLSVSGKYKTPLIFANPNAPSGIALSKNEIQKMAARADPEKVFIVDEAYCDFADESCLPLLKDFPNLIIVRTFSKSMCGAGLRIGFAVAHPDLIRTLTTVKNSVNHFPLDALSQIAGIASCEDAPYYAACTKKVCETRDDFVSFLQRKNWAVIPSKTNFALAKKPGTHGRTLYEKIKQAGILVRHFALPGIDDYVRITIGSERDTDALKNVIENI